MKGFTMKTQNSHAIATGNDLQTGKAVATRMNSRESLGSTDLTDFACSPSRNSIASAIVSKSLDQMAIKPSDDEGGNCGWFCFNPPFLRVFKGPKSFLFWMCCAGIVQGVMINGFINVFISTIEKRYELTSTDSGLIVGIYDIASFVSVLPISYFGSRQGTSKPRWVAVGIFLLAIGSFIFALPQFLSGLYQASQEGTFTTTCPLPSNIYNLTCHSEDQHRAPSSLSNYKYIFFLAQIILGIGASPLYTLGVAFIDENVSNKMQPIYNGIFYTIATLGPAFGYILGGQLLQIYVDFLVLSAKEAGITPASGVWVGAWWLGFVICGFLLFVFTIPFTAFPSQLPGAQALQKEKEEEAYRSKHSEKEPDPEEEDDKGPVSALQSLKELPIALKALATNLTFIFLSLTEAAESMIIAGFAAFLPKIIESQFSVSATISALIIGVIVIACGCGGTFLGGYLIKRFKLRCVNIIKLCMFTTALGFAFSFSYLVSCPNLDFAGISVPYRDNSSTEIQLDSECNAGCNCPIEVYNPICGVDNVMYFSPCHAGCVNSYGSGALKVYTNCSCIFGDPLQLEIDNQVIEVMATRQKCKSACSNLYIFIPLLFLFLSFTLINTMPILSATLRCVPSKWRAFALGIQMIIWRLLGSIPAPVFFGAFIDNACSFWQRTCTERGSCLVYDNPAFSKTMLGLALIGKGLAFIFITLGWWFYKQPVKPAVSVHSSQDTTSTVEVMRNEEKAYDNPCVDTS